MNTKKFAILALTACAFLLAPLPTLAQDAPDDPAAQAQEVEMPREVRVLVQRGLAFLGFDPGPADGLFGPKTRAAIWDWQAAKELEATGYLTLSEAEALAAIGAEASETTDMEVEAPADQEPDSAEAETATAPSKSRNQILYFPTCGTDDARPGGCWKALSSPAECVKWEPYDEYFDESAFTYSWSGECDDTSRASGRSTLDWEHDDFGHGSGSGEFVEGKMQGHWVVRTDSGYGWEGTMVDGEWHGRIRYKYGDGTSEVHEYRHGELVP